MEDLIVGKMREKTGEKEVEYGDKVIKIEVHFWTHGIVSDEEKRIPKVAWDSGTIHILRNDGHEIERSEPIHFESLSELQPTIEASFKERGMSLLHSRKYGPVCYP